MRLFAVAVALLVVVPTTASARRLPDATSCRVRCEAQIAECVAHGGGKRHCARFWVRRCRHAAVGLDVCATATTTTTVAETTTTTTSTTTTSTTTTTRFEDRCDGTWNIEDGSGQVLATIGIEESTYFCGGTPGCTAARYGDSVWDLFLDFPGWGHGNCAPGGRLEANNWTDCGGDGEDFCRQEWYLTASGFGTPRVYATFYRRDDTVNPPINRTVIGVFRRVE
jgi:hypothetical protein